VIAVLIDLLVAGLLLATLSYCIVLNRRLAALRDDKGELRELIRGLGAAAQRAEAGVASLRAAAEQIGVGLQQEIERARGLRDDLAYMIERGGGLADRLEGAIRQHRDEGRIAAPANAAAAARPAQVGARTRVEPAAPAVQSRAADALRGGAGHAADFPSRVERDLRRVLEGRR
jgi:hypothetical protein